MSAAERGGHLLQFFKADIFFTAFHRP